MICEFSFQHDTFRKPVLNENGQDEKDDNGDYIYQHTISIEKYERLKNVVADLDGSYDSLIKQAIYRSFVADINLVLPIVPQISISKVIPISIQTAINLTTMANLLKD